MCGDTSGCGAAEESSQEEGVGETSNGELEFRTSSYPPSFENLNWGHIIIGLRV